MAKITIELEDRTIEWLQMRADRDGTSVEQVAAAKLRGLRPRKWQPPSDEENSRLPLGAGEYRSKCDSDEEELLLVLTHNVRKRIRSWGRKIDKSEEEVIRQLVEIFFGQERNELPKGLEEFSSDDSTIARRTKQILAEAVESGEWP